jgi:putative transcriptional regulator
MDKWALLNDIKALLSRAGFYVSKIHRIRSISFDLVARRDNTLFIIKALQNVDALSYGDAEEMKLLADVLGGTVIVVSEKSSSSPLEDGVVYNRMGIPVLTFNTIKDYIEEGYAPLVFAAPGGFYVKIDGQALKQAREASGISRGDLADVAGVSRKAIQMYEEGMSMEVEAAIALEEYLGVPLVLPLDPFSQDVDSRISERRIQPDEKNPYYEIFISLDRMGYHVFQTEKSPFDALSERKNDVLLTNVGEYSRTLVKKAEIVSEVSDIAERDAVIFVRKQIKRESIEGVPVITFEELMRASLEELMELLIERKRE